MAEGERIFCGWANGSYVNSAGGAESFLEGLAELVRQYGKPDVVEIRTEADWIHS